MPVKVEQINEYFFSDTVQSQKTKSGSDEISQGQQGQFNIGVISDFPSHPHSAGVTGLSGSSPAVIAGKLYITRTLGRDTSKLVTWSTRHMCHFSKFLFL